MFWLPHSMAALGGRESGFFHCILLTMNKSQLTQVPEECNPTTSLSLSLSLQTSLDGILEGSRRTWGKGVIVGSHI